MRYLAHLKESGVATQVAESWQQEMLHRVFAQHGHHFTHDLNTDAKRLKMRSGFLGRKCFWKEWMRVEHIHEKHDPQKMPELIQKPCENKARFCVCVG